MTDKTEMRFYHLENSRAEQALPALLQKALSAGHKIIIKAKDKDRIKHLDDYLWAYDAASFLPHGTKAMGHEAKQPVYLTHDNENPNEADMLVLIDDTPWENDLESFKLCCRMFDGRKPEILENARAFWKELKDKNLDLTYWQQTETGWTKKA